MYNTADLGNCFISSNNSEIIGNNNTTTETTEVQPATPEAIISGNTTGKREETSPVSNNNNIDGVFKNLKATNKYTNEKTKISITANNPFEEEDPLPVI